ncbi:von Willebrand factor type A domain-containing protein [Alienimonas sp. DA493]|uniref:vWA domain-containing protein n=1 Tax=Alienimonas sp. DA493 TaxID=3373605 RepID=UPI00375509F3
MFRPRSPRVSRPAAFPRRRLAGLPPLALLAALALAPTLSGCGEEEARDAAVLSAPADEAASAAASGRPIGRVSGETAEEYADAAVDAFDAEADMAPVGGEALQQIDAPLALNENAPAAEPTSGPAPAAGALAGVAAMKAETRALRARGATEQARPAERLEESLVERQTDRLERERLSDFSREQYAPIPENRFLSARDTPLSTFAVDVDTASYANVRRFLKNGQLPPPGAVRIEELVNYFRYDYEPPPAEGDGDGEPRPFAVHAEVAACPWAPDHRLVRIGLKGREMEADARPLCNLVFLLDVSGSMNSDDKLGLVKQAMTLLTQQLGENDTVSIVVYAGASGLALPPTGGDDPQAILDALDNLAAGGSTNGGEGIELAYRVARENFIQGGVNRVILCTDGDFNVGVTDDSSLVAMVEEKAKAGVSLTVLGFGTGNYQDAKMEQLADKGDGNYGYIDDLREARKMLVEQLTGTLVTIAKDVKIQADFNPAAVTSYRLIGYENRKMAAEDFRDDAKDAGEIGAGHAVTALYEVVPAGSGEAAPETPQSKYQTPGEPTEAAVNSGELLTVNLRYKAPDATKEDPATEFSVPVPDSMGAFEDASEDYRFAAAVAAFGMLLRGSEHSGTAKFGDAAAWAEAARGEDPHGYREEFVGLAEQAARLSDR